MRKFIRAALIRAVRTIAQFDQMNRFRAEKPDLEHHAPDV
jgi:hypothetical protein